MRFRVRDSLRYGKEAAIASKPLAEALGFRSVRDLQKQIEKERSAGAVILSDPCGGGYYLSDDPAELCDLPGHWRPGRGIPSKLRSRHTEPWMPPRGKKV